MQNLRQQSKDIQVQDFYSQFYKMDGIFVCLILVDLGYPKVSLYLWGIMSLLILKILFLSQNKKVTKNFFYGADPWEQLQVKMKNKLVIMYLSQTKHAENIIACVLDSPYNSLCTTIAEIGKYKTGLPEFILNRIISYIRTVIKTNHNFDIKQMELKNKVQRIQIPTMYITSQNDNFINSKHVIQLYKNTLTKNKILEYIEQEHNSPRESDIIQIGIRFMRKNMKESFKKKEIKNGKNMAQKIVRPYGKGCSQIRRFNSFSYIVQEKNKKIEGVEDDIKKVQKNSENQQNNHPNIFYHNISTICYPKDKKCFSFKKSLRMKTEHKDSIEEEVEEDEIISNERYKNERVRINTMHIKQCLFSPGNSHETKSGKQTSFEEGKETKKTEKQEDEDEDEEYLIRKQSLKEIFERRRKKNNEEKEKEKQQMNMIRVNVDKKLLKKRKGNNNMINRTSLKIDMLKK